MHSKCFSPKKSSLVTQLRAPEGFRASSLTKKDSCKFSSEKKKEKLNHFHREQTIKRYRNANSLTKLKVIKQNVDRLHLEKS